MSLSKPLDATAGVIADLQRLANRRTLEGMAEYGIPSGKAIGVSVGDLQKLARRLGKNHDLAQSVWETGWYEARMLACYLDEPDCVSPAQMDRWSGQFDNWAICDTACFALFDRTPHAWQKVARWATRRKEFVKRAAFALLWGLSVHDKESGDQPFLQGLELIERAADDERHYVMKGVNMALRAVGKRNRALHAAAIGVARRLAESSAPASAWVGKHALRELLSSKVSRRLAD